jgi:hypothetical protein
MWGFRQHLERTNVAIDLSIQRDRHSPHPVDKALLENLTLFTPEDRSHRGGKSQDRKEGAEYKKE